MSSSSRPYRVGVLALQGGFQEHLHLLAHFNKPDSAAAIAPIDVRSAEDLSSVDALIVPGGESSAIRLIAREKNLIPALRAFTAEGKPVWGVCAGLIFLAREIEGKDIVRGDVLTGEAALENIGGLDIRVTRNFFGRQSSSALMRMTLSDEAKAAGCSDVSHFIRAPAVDGGLEGGVGRDVQVLASIERSEPAQVLAAVQDVVAVRQGNLLGTAFHPEVTNDKSWHRYFLLNVCHLHPEALNLDDRLPQHGANMMMTSIGSSLQIPVACPLGLSADLLLREHGDLRARGLQSVKNALPRFLQGGVIMDVVNAEQARVAEKAGACSVMALERIPADIKKDGGIARMSDPSMIQEILDTVSLPVMAKARIGHFAEARALEALDVDCIDESEVLTPADEVHHIPKAAFQVPFVCGAKDLGEALRRIAEGAALIRLKGNAGTGNVLHAVRHARAVFGDIRRLRSLSDDELCVFAKEHAAPLHLVELTRSLGRLPVTTFAAGGIATPADVALMMEMGCDGVFVGSGIFKGANSAERARAMVLACTYWRDPKMVAQVSRGLGKAMVGVLDNGETYNFVLDSKL
jgi:pyridoxal 5'-phosphate synthase pdxS subunit